jgi:acyl phosphate:glycerol-3-phosphate acyltransferase
MFLTTYTAVWLLTGFLAGSVPFGWLVARARGVDIRQVGSGNIGMTNVWRALGWQAGVLVLVGDLLKGLLPVLLAEACLVSLPVGRLAPGAHGPLLMIVGLSAILGHTFTPWLRFKGGKGVATAAGVLIALLKLWMLVPIAVLLLLVAVFRYVSLGNLVAALVMAGLCLGVPALRPYWPLGVLAAALVWWTHRSNLKRLLDGTEPKVGRQKTNHPPTAN